MTVDSSERTLRFSDGFTIQMRPLGIHDGRLLASFASRMSTETRYRRFFTASGGVHAKWVGRLVGADQVDLLVQGAVASDGFGEALIAVAESVRLSPTTAEFAMVADDGWHNLGVGTLLARHLAVQARSVGVEYWESYILAENLPILRVLDRVGRRVETGIDAGVTVTVHRLE